MNNGRSSTTTSIWWVKHLAMMDGWGPVLVPHSSTIHVRYTAPQNPKHTSKQKLYLSLNVRLLESSAQAFAIQFTRGICFYLPVLFCFFLAFSLLSSLSKTFEAMSKSAKTFFKDGTWLKAALWDWIVTWSPPGGCVFEFRPHSSLVCNHAALW